MFRPAAWILRYRLLIVGIALVLSALGTIYSLRLYATLKPNFEELLPRSARSVRDLDEVRGRLKAIDNLAILVFSDEVDASRRFVDDLAQKLKQLDDPMIARVEHRIENEIRFFQNRRPLYMELEDLKKVRRYVRERIRYEEDLRNPLNIFAEIEIPEPKLDLEGMSAKYESRVAAYTRFPRGYYATPDERRRVILVYKSGGTVNSEELRLFKDKILKAVSELNPVSYASDLEIHYSGNIEHGLQEQAAVIEDLKSSFILVMVLVITALVIFFRSAVITFSLIASLLMGTLWTFGICYFLVGTLNANSAFLGSIIVGNGINFGIILCARYVETRRRGAPAPQAHAMALKGTAAATLTAALAAALSYGSLSLTVFRGFRQFGVIGLIGMVLCWISAYTVLPALISLLDRKTERHMNVAGEVGTDRSILFSALVRMLNRFAAPIAVVSIFATIVASTILTGVSADVLEADLTRIRSRESEQHGSAFYSRYVDEIFQRYLSPVVILPQSRAETRVIAENLRERQRMEGDASLIASVQTVDDFVPRQQREKIRVLKDIRELLTPRIMERVSAPDRKLVNEFLHPAAFRPVTMPDLPALILDRFRENDGTLGRLVLVEPPLGQRMRERENLFKFVGDLRKVADSVAPGIPVAGSLPVTADMLGSVAKDGPRATLFAFIAVIVLVTILFRHLRTAGAVLMTLLLGVAWLSAILIVADIKINFLNFIALPITFGIGVDYGVNVFQRYRQEGRGAILSVVKHTGAAVALCSLTTIIGYGSLLFAKNRGFFGFGLVAVLGELTCIIAALMTVPALIHWRDTRAVVKPKEAQKQRAA